VVLVDDATEDVAACDRASAGSVNRKEDGLGELQGHGVVLVVVAE